MATVVFTHHLHRFFPDLKETQAAGTSVAELLRELEKRYPGLADYIVDERGALRKHVNIFVNEERVRDRATLSDPLTPEARVAILQALSGG